MSKIRQQRTAEQLRLVLSDLFLRQLSDPRLHGVTVTKLDIDRELEHADIYVSALGDESRETDVMTALGSAEGFLRRNWPVGCACARCPSFTFIGTQPWPMFKKWNRF